MNNDVNQYLTRVENALDQALNNAAVPEQLLSSMRYSTLGGGKRVRALLVYASGTTLNATISRLDSVAAAIECIHSYSLIHDDLPAMDDDDLRRGKATNHKAYDEATAILAGDALLTLAFEIVNTNTDITDQQARKITQTLATAAGQAGMVGGQMLDMLATEQALELHELEDIHRRKTGALIQAALLCGAFCSDKLTVTQERALTQYADNIGLAFQVVDDILDIESSTETLGKTSGVDLAMGKSTYPALIGLEESKQLAQKLYQQAIASIDSIGDNTRLLIDLADMIVKRDR